MKRYLKAAKFWAGLFSLGKRRYIWQLLHHYGDWVAPEADMWTWMLRGKYTATASLARCSGMVAQIAELLGYAEDAAYYRSLKEKASDAYRSILMDKDCRIKKEFQTAYVLPLYYDMLSGQDKEKAAGHLSRLVRNNGYHIGTGFPGTPYILFALCDNGYAEDAFSLLLQDSCPSWLYEVKTGGTTIWERWDALREDGTCNTGEDDGTGGMTSFNHYASGAVGDFLYRRIAGIEGLTGGYGSFRICPVVGGGITWAKGTVRTGYGQVCSEWKLEEGNFTIHVSIPVSASCQLVMPSGQEHRLGSGEYTFMEPMQENGKTKSA
jgi:alpha-L-rhamnosidase